MKINLTVEDEDLEKATDEMHKILDDIWDRYPRAVVEHRKNLPSGNNIEFEIK